MSPVIVLALLIGWPLFILVLGIWGISVTIRKGRKVQRLMDAATRYYQDGSSRGKS